MKNKKRILDPKLVWQFLLSAGKDWTVQSVADAINSATGENWTRQGVSKIIHLHGFKDKLDDLQKLAKGASPDTRDIMDRVARRMRLEDLTNSTVALEAYNEAIIMAADHIVTKIPAMQIEKPVDFVAVMNALAVALQAQTGSRKDLAEILSMIGPGKKDRDDLDGSIVPKQAGNVLSIRDKVAKAAGKQP